MVGLRDLKENMIDVLRGMWCYFQCLLKIFNSLIESLIIQNYSVFDVP